MNGEKKHLLEDEVVRYAMYELSDVEKLRADEHLANCNDCQYSLDRLNQVLAIMQDDKTETVPSHLSDSVLRLFPYVRSSAASEFSLVRLLASLRFDRLVPVQGLRHEGHQTVRQLAFSAESAEITLSIFLLESGLWRIDGRLISEDLGISVELRAESQNLESEIDDLGEFSFEGISDGRVELIAKTAEFLISFPAIDLKK